MIDETVPPERVAIVGAGVIGAAWAARWLLRGVDVAVSDPSSDAPRIVSQVLDNARRAWTRMGTAPKHEGKLDFSDSVEAAVLDADLVQESVPENLELKKATLKQIERFVGAGTLLASSTSGLKPTALQQDMERPERLVVGHPFNPVYLLPMVEVVGGELTSSEAISRAMALYSAAGMHPLHVRVEIDAFIADRLLEAVWREALWLVNDGVATTQEIDDVIRFGFGLRWAQMGLFENYRIAGGESGMAHFISQFGPTLSWPWSRLTDTPELTEALTLLISEQSDSQSGHHTIAELERIRDENLVDIMLALEKNQWGAGQSVSDLRR